MPDAGPTRPVVDAIRDDIACPSCEYNLRGLYGDVVHCPECGTRCDVVALMTRRWEGPWYKAPGFHRVVTPAGVAVVSVLTGFVSAVVFFAADYGAPEVLLSLMLLIGSVVWLWSMRGAYRVFNGWRGVWLALLAHAVFLGYLMSALMLVGFLVAVLLKAIVVPGTALATVTSAILGILLGWVSRRGERYIAQECIRRHLVSTCVAGS